MPVLGNPVRNNGARYPMLKADKPASAPQYGNSEADIGMVRLISHDPPLEVYESLGPMKPRVVSAYGGWENTARRRDVALTDWAGRDPLKVTFQVFFQSEEQTRSWRLREGLSVEKACRTLEKMGGLDRDDPEPPVLIVNGGGAIPHDYHEAPHVLWHIETLEWDEETEERNDYGNRTLALGTLVISQHVEEDVLASLSAANEVRKKSKKGSSKKGKAGARKKSYTVKSGDTLASIAADKLGNYRRWPEIAKLNSIRDPSSIKVGDDLRMP